VTASLQSVKLLVGPLIQWMETGGDAWEVNLSYWDTRRELMQVGEMFDGPAGEYLSNIDTAMDSFNPDADRGSHEIDEAQLKLELGNAIGRLRGLGYLAEETAPNAASATDPTEDADGRWTVETPPKPKR
jgi:hypothetical protein